MNASWRERALNAEDALRLAHTEIAAQRTTIGQLLGKIRELTTDKGRLEERLKSARDNNRFLDKRIADLEAELADRLLIDQRPS